jgi:hypothetical protein
MFRRLLRPPSADRSHDDGSPTPADDHPASPDDALHGGPASIGPDLAALPVLGMTRRRVAGVIAALLAAWIVIVFARQVSEASAATALADEIAAGNVASATRVAALERELDLIAGRRYVMQQARGYGLGTSHEIPFTLSPDAPALPEDAPGSAAARVGAEATDVSPLERWLILLFGPSS